MNGLRTIVHAILSLKWRWLGLLVGVAVWMAWMLFGLWATLLLVILAGLGFTIGRIFEENQSWKNIVDKLLSDRFGE